MKTGLLSMVDPYSEVSGGSVPTGGHKTVETEVKAEAKEVKELTTSMLQGYWEVLFARETLSQFSDPEKVTNFLKGIKPELGDDGKTVTITLTSSFAEHEVKKVLPEIMSQLRRTSGVQDLTPKIVVKVEEKAARPYQSGEKYESMLKINPELAALRKILPDIDI